MKNGITDLNTSKASDLETVRKDLLALMDDVDPRIPYDAAYNKLPKDKFSLMTAWSGDIVAGWGYAPPYTEQAYEAIGYWFPADRKGPIDNDLIAIPKNAEHPALAHEFINFWISFRHAMDNFSWNGYQPPQNAGRRGRAHEHGGPVFEEVRLGGAGDVRVPLDAGRGRPARATSRRIPRRSAAARRRRPVARDLGRVHRRCRVLASPTRVRVAGADGGRRARASSIHDGSGPRSRSRDRSGS